MSSRPPRASGGNRRAGDDREQPTTTVARAPLGHHGDLGANGRATPEQLHWYRWCPGDWLRLTRGWPLVAKGVVRELLDAQWDQGGLPKEEATLRKLVDASPTEWRSVWPYVEQQFPLGADGRRRNSDLEERRTTARERYEKQQAASQTAHDARWGANRRARVVKLRPGGGDA